MADDSNRIGSSASTAGMDLLRQLAGIGAPGATTPVAAAGGSGGAVTAASGSGGGGGTPAGAFGPRGSRVLPADYPLDQLDRRAARGTYLDILV